MTPPLLAEMAPDFRLTDTHGRAVRLSDFRDAKHIVLVFNRGFA